MGNWSGWENYKPDTNNKVKTKKLKGSESNPLKVTDQLPKVTEKELTKQIREYLRLKGIFHWKVWQGLGSQKGIPDILGILCDGRLLAIEVKTSRGKVRPEQQAFIDNAVKLGAIAFVARSVVDVQKQLELSPFIKIIY